MESLQQVGTTSDINTLVARIAEGNADIKTKHAAACELRELIDTAKEEALRAYATMIPVLIQVLRNGEAVFKRDTTEFQFRRVLLEILNRVQFGESNRQQSLALTDGLLFLLRHDNEDNAVTCCKTLIEITRALKTVTDETVADFISTFQDICRNMSGVVHSLLADDSAPVDSNVLMPSIRSFKVLAEIGAVVITLAQYHRGVVDPGLMGMVPLNFQVLALESPTQKKAREDFEAMGGVWAGPAPNHVNPGIFSDFILAQGKTVSYLAFLLRSQPDKYEAWGDVLTSTTLRLLQDCPAHMISPRKDLFVVLRHFMATPHRRVLLGSIDKLLDERVLLGTTLSVKELLRPNAYVAIAELFHQHRQELNAPQLAKIAYVYSRLLHNAYVGLANHITFAKMLFTLLEPAIALDVPQVVTAILEASVERLESAAAIQQEVINRAEAAKNGEQESDTISFIEKARPVQGATYAIDKPDDILNESRNMLKALLHGFRGCLMHLKKIDHPLPDGTIIFRIFEGVVTCMNVFDSDPHGASEVAESFASLLSEMNLHTFQEVWSLKIGMLFEHAKKRPFVLGVCQHLFGREHTSPILLSIVLNFLIQQMPSLGDLDDNTAVIIIRWFKIAFGAVTVHPTRNEPILASHLSKLIMDCFPLAAKAKKPTHYYHMLRALFRAIGSAGGKFELLYKEVLPLLPEMLECFNRHLNASEGYTREMIVELCLTVPLRLTHLLPHLSYLMRPLTLALRANSELVAQGLRTLELCIDNLTAEFLDPTLEPTLRELTEALHSHLKPQPANHVNSHSAIRILGKLGGRNRRLLWKDPVFEYRSYTDTTRVLISFDGRPEEIALAPAAGLAMKGIRRSGTTSQQHALKHLKTCLSVLAQQGVEGRDAQANFTKALESMFDAVHFPEVGVEAEAFILQLSHHVFASDIRNSSKKEPALRRYPGSMLASYLDALPQALTRDTVQESEKAQAVFAAILRKLVALDGTVNVRTEDIINILHQIGMRFSAMCLEDLWIRKSAGCNGIKTMLEIPEPCIRWIYDRDIDVMRTLLHVLKDLPSELPRDVDDVIQLMKRLLRISDSNVHFREETSTSKKLPNIMGVLFSDLSSPNPLVREAVQTCIGVVSELSGKSPYELLLPQRDRVLQNLYTKPLRALPYALQIGVIEAIRYCVSLDPPLPEVGDELLRLLHETIALASAKDITLLGRSGNPRHASLEIVRLKVACIKLLYGAIPVTDCYAKHSGTHTKVTEIFFNSLYSDSPEIKEVAHEGLALVLKVQNRLPRDMLQTGLRPILMNLADPKRLTVPGLDGLARLLKLLTNYFKVEVGHKLLDHFRQLADPENLQEAAKDPASDNEVLQKLVRLANIFHLLPANANIFLENLTNSAVQIEAVMKSASVGLLSVPLGLFLNRYAEEGAAFFIRHLPFPRHVRTLRSILQAGVAPRLQREIVSRTHLIVNNFIRGNDPSRILPTLHLFLDLVDLEPNWLPENPYLIDALLHIWRVDKPQDGQAAMFSPDMRQRHSAILALFEKALEQTPRIDLLFDVVSIYSRGFAMDFVRLTQFLYRLVALEGSLAYRRNILYRFTDWFRDTAVPWADKSFFLRTIVTPMILVQSTRNPKDGLLDQELISRFLQCFWLPMNDGSTFADADDILHIEMLHLTTALVRYFHETLTHAKKDIIRSAWHYITSEDAIIKQTAYLLAARFFEVFDTPQKFILRAWTGLLRPPQEVGRALTRQSLDIIAPTLAKSATNEAGFPQWAKTTRRLLAEDGAGMPQISAVYHLIVRQPDLFYPVRALFVPHMVSQLARLGLSMAQNIDTRTLSVEILQLIFNWDQKTAALEDGKMDVDSDTTVQPTDKWMTPLSFRETAVGFLLKFANVIGSDAQAKNSVAPRALALLRQILSPTGWKDVTVKLSYFMRTLEQTDLLPDNQYAMVAAVGAAKVLQTVCADKPDEWFIENANTLQRLVRRGLLTEEAALHDALHPIFDRLIRLFPLPKEDEESQGDMADFHSYTYSAINDGLRDATALRATLMMLTTVVQVDPIRVEPFCIPLMKIVSKLVKDHLSSAPGSNADNTVRLLISAIEVARIAVGFLGDQRKWLLAAIVALVERSKSLPVCTYLLEVARDWALHKKDPYPTMKEKASLLQKMVLYETRGEPLFHQVLDLIYDIYTDPALRRSDLTTRLEYPFLLGCRVRDTAMRERFVELLDANVPRSLFGRLTYILGAQSWEALADHNWIHLALYLLLGAADLDVALLKKSHFSPNSLLFAPSSELRADSFVPSLQRLIFLDFSLAHDLWVTAFPAAWSCLSRREQVDITHHMITLLSKDYHVRQAHVRPNVVQTLLAGLQQCTPDIILPPHLVKYLAKTFGAWHISLEILGSALEYVPHDEPTARDIVYDSLAEIYAELAEDDMLYGIWRRRSVHAETNAGIAFEQNGMWDQTAAVYETALMKAKMGTIHFAEPEYCLWEDHWVLAQEKLQQWEILYELGRNDNNHELILESAWRFKNWSENREAIEEQVRQLPEVATPRRRVFESFLSLLKSPHLLEKNMEFQKLLEDAMQITLRKWVSLPAVMSAAHVPLLQHFQQFIELQEAVQIFGSLSTTTAQNLEKKSSDLKMVLQAWRERLPNLSDDINIWSDLVAWRRHVFNAINAAYIPLIGNNGQNGASAGNSSNTAGYRGFHETAWIINRFAHVARKHELLDVCFNQLTAIYTLPNIEISEAFLKLREQAICHYQRPSEIQSGLDGINNTNLMYFSNPQKAEFYTLKGMFHAKCGRTEEANQAFGQAVQMDMTQPKAWAQWGKYSDLQFKENPTDLTHAANAVSCYLQAAGLYKNGKSRGMLARVLWLLSVDDASFTISRQFDGYKGDAAFWYWIAFIPHLCLSISQREVKQARYILLNLAKLFPQALFYQLRTTKDEMNHQRRQAMNRQQMSVNHSGVAAISFSAQAVPGAVGQGSPPQGLPVNMTAGTDGVALASRQPWEFIEEVVQILKTAFPLLVLSLETMVDQISQRFKASPEEETYRLVGMLLMDATQTYTVRANSENDDGGLQPNTVSNLSRMSNSLGGATKADFEADFLRSKLTHYEYMRRLQTWRDRYEKFLDARPQVQSLDFLSHYLTEFQYGKFDDIEIPGQYTEERDTNQNFVRIQRFGPKVENCRSNAQCWRRITLIGHDGSKTAFSIQNPTSRHARREERLMQVLRTFNGHLARKKETRKRNLSFYLPAAIPCSPALRLLESDPSGVFLSDIFEQHCEKTGISKEEPVLAVGEKVRSTLREFKQMHNRQPDQTEYWSLKRDLYDEIALKMVPDNVLTKYMVQTMVGPSELWRMRKQFATQLSATSFATYVFCLSQRIPSKFYLSRETGKIAMMELAPGFAGQVPVVSSQEVVPFRFTPNMQQFVGTTHMEGVMTAGIMSIGRALTETENELEHQLCLFSRDEVMTWLAMRNKLGPVDAQFRSFVLQNNDYIIKRAETLACKLERNQALNSETPWNPQNGTVVQTVTNLLSTAMNPLNLVKMTELFHPWF